MDKEIIVVKLGGSIFEDKDTSLTDIAELYKQNRKLVIIHGGAAKVSSWMDKMTIPVKMVNGERVTTAEGLEVVTAILAGLMNKEICAALLDLGVKACGLSGVDGGIAIGQARGDIMGLMGDVTVVDPELLQIILSHGFLPVIAPISFNNAKTRQKNNERLLNINGDPLAGALASAINAQQLIFLTDTAGVRNYDGQYIHTLDISEADSLIKNGIAQGGMIPKLKAAILGAQNGVQTAIINGRIPHALIKQLGDENMGTVIRY